VRRYEVCGVAFGVFCLLALCTLYSSVAAQPGPIYTAGIMTKSYDERRAKALEKFEEIIAKYLEDRAGLRLRLKSFTQPDLERAIEKEQVDFIWGYGLIVSMELGRRFPILPILAPALGVEKQSRFKRLAIAAKEIAPGLPSGIPAGPIDFKDFQGKRLSFVGDEQWSFELLFFKVWAAETFGVKDITRFMAMKGKDPDEGFFIPASKRGAIYPLFIREADVAVVHEFEYTVQEKLTPNAIRDRAEVLPLTNPPEGFMESPLFVRKNLDKKVADHLVKVLMEMPEDPEGKQILLSSKMSGFTKVTDSDYQSVKALIGKKERLGIK